MLDEKTFLSNIKRRTNVFDVGPTLYTCYTDTCVYWDVWQQQYNYTPHNIHVYRRP